LLVDSAQKSRGGLPDDAPVAVFLYFAPSLRGATGGRGWLPVSPRQWNATPAPI